MNQFKWKECYGCSSPTRCEAEKTCYINAIMAGYDTAQSRAAPSLSREEWRLIGVAINGYFTGPTSTVELEALRAKVREASKSRP